jgi:hypothetical protein
LRLARDIPKPSRQTYFSVTGLLSYLAKNWKIVGTCLIPFVIVAAALHFTSSLRQNEQPAPTPAPKPATAAPVSTNLAHTTNKPKSGPPQSNKPGPP